MLYGSNLVILISLTLLKIKNREEKINHFVYAFMGREGMYLPKCMIGHVQKYGDTFAKEIVTREF